MCVIARDDEIEDFEWYDDASVDTTGLHIPSSTAVEHGTPVYSEDRRAPSSYRLLEWGGSDVTTGSVGFSGSFGASDPYDTSGCDVTSAPF